MGKIFPPKDLEKYWRTKYACANFFLKKFKPNINKFFTTNKYKQILYCLPSFLISITSYCNSKSALCWTSHYRLLCLLEWETGLNYSLQFYVDDFQRIVFNI